jgi:cation diffusion facilitator CzcD-associated flavoprotein CzcO
MLISKEANDTAADFIKSKIRSIVKDPKTAAVLSDIDHPYAAKRPPIDTDYFETYNRPNVTLVDVKAAPIRQISETGIRTDEAEHPVDIIVFATGFDAMTGPLLRMDIRGRGGIALKHVWEAGPRNYLGLQVAGFRTCSPSRGPVVHRFGATCRWPSSNTSTGSPIASITCGLRGWNGSRHGPRPLRGG